MRAVLAALILCALFAPAEARHARHISKHYIHLMRARRQYTYHHRRFHLEIVHHRFHLAREIVHLIDRPFHMIGKLLFAGHAFHFGSGGMMASVPLGTYPINGPSRGRWGSAHRAIDINGGKIWDASLHRYRIGIELHGGRGDRSEGCVVVKEFAKLRPLILASIRHGQKLYMHIGSKEIEINDHS